MTKEEKAQNEEEKGKETTNFNYTIGQTHSILVDLNIDNHWIYFFQKELGMLNIKRSF